ncbi:MAG: hypothetical protein ACOYO1_17080 [Bacteroidales bacterium]
MSENETERKRIFKLIALDSTVIYVLAFLFVYFVYQFITAFIAGQYFIRVVLFYNELKFLTPDNSKFWYSDSALTIFASGPLVSIFLAFVFIMLYRKFSNSDSIIKLFFLWGALHFINRVIGSFAIGSIFLLYGSNLIVDWLYLGMEIKILVVVAAIIVLLIIGNYSVFPLLTSANSFTLINSQNRTRFVKNQIFVPWLFGSFILFLIYLPRVPVHELLINLSMLIMLLPTYFRFENVMIPNVEDDPPMYSFSWTFVSFFVVLLAAFRIILGRGIRFGTETENASGVTVILIIISIILLSLGYLGIRSIIKRRKHVYNMIIENLPDDGSGESDELDTED